MFEQYVPFFVVFLAILMLISLVVLAVRLESLGRAYYVADVVSIMGMTSVITACLVGLFVLLLLYRPTGGECKGDKRTAGPAAEHPSAREGPRATLSEAYPHERLDVSANPLMDATRDTEGD